MNAHKVGRLALTTATAGFFVGLALLNGGTSNAIGGLCNGRPASHTWLDASGQYGPALIDGTNDDDDIIGSDGDDIIDAGDGDDVVCGAAGDDGSRVQAAVGGGDRSLSRQRRMERQGRRLCDPGPRRRLRARH